MKRLMVFVLLVVSSQIMAEVLHPATWKFEMSNPNPKVGDEIALIFHAKIDGDWYLYSTDFDPDLGPLITEFTFEPHQSYELIGEIKPNNPKKKYDSLWEGEITYFKKTGQFVQKAIVKEVNPVIRGSYFYQVCTDVDGKCIPFDEEFDFSSTEKSNKLEKVEIEESTQNQSTDQLSIFWFMILAFVTGLAALVTPCVFPMIPMTVSFFLKDDQESRAKGIKNGIIFGLSIIFIYTILGTGFAFILGADGLNAMATHWLPNTFIFVLFVLFAVSFLGAFEITMPSRFVNKMDAKSEQGGLIGIFFMAFTLALVSFSCTVPIVGSVLVLSAGGEIIKPILGMLAFSLAFALPFTLFAIFPGWLRSLPKSGGWLNSVKVVLGFLELALALKFLSIADQAYHWHILDREVYLALWIVIFALLGFYFLGKIKMPHDSKSDHTSISGLLMGIVTFSFVVYMIPGLWGAPLKALSGYLPPLSSQDFISNSNTIASIENVICETPKYGDDLHFPHGLQGYFDYEQALACAKKQGKPVFIDFTGHGCVNCREMEARVWSDPEVLNRLSKDFVMLALYVDDKTTLPESAWVTSQYDGKIKKTLGKKNADFQITRFNNNAQPYYVILDTNGDLLLPPKAYDLNIANFVKFLDQAKQKFSEGSQ
ncbi:MAG: thioredoxin family protein [Reichenbachiella sp.]